MNPNPKIHAPNGAEFEILAGTAMPNSPGCELALLGSIILDRTPAGWALACSIGVKSNAFFVPAHRTIWSAIHELRTRGVPELDPAIVVEELRITGKLEEAGGHKYIVDAMAAAGYPGQNRFFAEQLVLIWHQRHAITLGGELREAALNFESREAFTKTASDIGQRLLRLGRRDASKTLAEEILEVEGDVAARAGRTDDQSRWVSSGLPTFDEKCKPFTGGREDQMIVIGGGSGLGKSAVLRQLAHAALEQNKTVLSFSRETSTAGFIEMMIAAQTEVDLLQPDLIPERIPAFRAKCQDVLARWADKTLFCVQHSAATPLLTVEDLEDQTHAFVNLRGQPNFILIDYLQLFGTRKRLGSREETVATVSHRLQALVREYPGTTMIVAVQLNETGLEEMRQIRYEKKEDGSDGRIIHRLPKPGDIRESQAIYHDADRMIFLYRPPVDCRGADQRSPQVGNPEVWWYQEKRRRGGGGCIRCWFQKRFTRFVEVARHESEAAEDAEISQSGRVPRGGMDKDEWRRGRGK